ncbi:MAG TPA: hypothetical protein VFQ47_08310, partial [Nitrososphaera sp.]|nr:hypothetical protein [Nitrososphaera sp.]
TQLSTSAVHAATASVQLNFASALETQSASDPAHYTVEVATSSKFAQAVVESASYSPSSNTVTLGLAEGSLETGEQVIVHWSDLSDARGKTLNGQVGPLTAR